MQHVHRHAGNFGNECADHAAALVSLGLVSSHNLATRWVGHNFDTSACCGDCDSISEVCCVPHRVLSDSHARIASLVVLLSAPFPAQPSRSTASSSGESVAHNMWNPLLELLFHGQISGAFEPFIVETDLAKIALSCHLALDLLCYKEGGHDFA